MSFGRQFSASPVLTMSPQSVHQAPFGGAGFAPQQIPAPSSFVSAMPMSAPSAAAAPQFSVKNSRKRSRDEASSNLEPDAPPPQPKESEDEWVYGPGMVLIKASKGYVADASSQSGTWLEEKKAADELERRKQEREQLVPRVHKLQRMDRGLDLNASVPAQANGSPNTGMNQTSPVNDGPAIDDFTLHLGIGWKKISDDEHIQAAARGWARYIENHYPVTNAHIRLESKGLQSYLVEASEGFFLFAEDLRQGRLVSTNVDGVFANLRTSPPTFEGAETLVAAGSPSPAVSPQAAPGDAEMQMD